MTDNLVERLREKAFRTETYELLEDAADRIEALEYELVQAFNHMMNDTNLFVEASDRIEKLAAALHEWDALIHHQYTGSREAMSDMQYAAQITAALLHGEAPYPETRIEKLEKALQKIADIEHEDLPKPVGAAEGTLWAILAGCVEVAEKALEGEDD